MERQRRPSTFLWQQIYRSETVPIVVQRVAPMDGDFEPHSHDFVEIVLVLAGQGRHVSLNGERELAPRDVITLRPGAWHIYRACRNLEVYNCCLRAELFQRELAWTSQEAWFQQIFQTASTRQDHLNVRFFHFPPEVFDACLHHLDGIHAEKQTDGALQRPAILGHLLLFFSQLARHISTEQAANNTMTGEEKRALPGAVLAIRSLLDEQPAHPWNLAELSARLGLDRAYLVRLFTAHLGTSPMAYLARVRAEQAAQLLIATDQPIAAIGRLVGWPEARHFARRFKAHTGLSASEYRARFFSPLIQPDQTHPAG